MNKKRYILSFLFFLSYAFYMTGSPMAQPVNDRYNLSFNMKDGALWSWQTRVFSGLMRIDTTQPIASKGLFCVEQAKTMMNIPLRFFIYQTITLPADVDNRKIDISIKAKSRQLEKASFKITCFNSKEDVYSVDSVDINTSDWQEKSISFKGSDLHFIHMEISGCGDSARMEGQFWIDRVSITIDGKDINRCADSAAEKSGTIQDDSLFFHPEKRIDLFRDKKIIAFGETVHGCTQVEVSVFELIKELILRGECKLVFLELPINRGLLWNAFIEGRTPLESMEVIKDDLSTSFSSTEVFSQFLFWLREYNDKTDRKVHLVGIDYVEDFLSLTPFYSLFYFCMRTRRR